MNKNNLFCAAIAVGVLITSGTAVVACKKPTYGGAELTAIPTSRINQNLLNRVITKETNYYRCTRGLKALSIDPKLMAAARLHSRNMARMNNMSHNLPVSGARNMKQRYAKAGVEVKKVRAENISTEFRMAFNMQYFLTKDSKRCMFTYRANNKPVPVHSYASLGRSIVDRWWDSKSHRDNILNRHIKRVGSAGQFANVGRAPCGTYFVTQNFAG